MDNRKIALNDYLSPSNEVSISKNIPMKYLDMIKLNFPGVFRYRYRGPSNPTYNRPQSYCLMDQATSFAVYERRNRALCRWLYR